MAIAPEDNQPVGQSTGATTDAHEEELLMPDEVELKIDGDEQAAPVQKKNYDLTSPIMSDMSDDEFQKKKDHSIPLLPDTTSQVDKTLDSTKTEVDQSEAAMEWYQNLLNGFKAAPSHGVFEDALADPNAHWKNALVFGGQTINMGRPRYSSKGANGRMSSERLTLSIRAHLGLGAPVQSQMMGSGFYVTAKPLSEEEIILLWREIMDSTIKLGRATHGLLFSNDQVFTASAIVQAWVRSIVETTVSDLPLENIIDHLTINDLPIIAQAMAVSIYPNGFPMTRSIFTALNEPAGDVSQLIDLRKALMMNEKSFTEGQLAHMVKRIGQPMTLKSVKDYRDGFVFSQPTVVTVSDRLKLHLHTPSLREYFESGEKWINEIQVTIKNALGDEAEPNVRAQYVSRLAKASRLRQYAHFVKAIEDDGEMHTTREAVDSTLAVLSASDDISRNVYKAISDYINATQVAIVATTSVTEYEDGVGGDKFPRLIPIDTISVFFRLVERKLVGITSRSLEDTLA